MPDLYLYNKAGLQPGDRVRYVYFQECGLKATGTVDGIEIYRGKAYVHVTPDCRWMTGRWKAVDEVQLIEAEKAERAS